LLRASTDKASQGDDGVRFRHRNPCAARTHGHHDDVPVPQSLSGVPTNATVELRSWLWSVRIREALVEPGIRIVGPRWHWRQWHGVAFLGSTYGFAVIRQGEPISHQFARAKAHCGPWRGFLRPDPIARKSYTMYSDDTVTEISVERSSPSEPDFLPN